MTTRFLLVTTIALAGTSVDVDSFTLPTTHKDSRVRDGCSWMSMSQNLIADRAPIPHRSKRDRKNIGRASMLNSKTRNRSRTSSWSRLKGGVYTCVDTISTIPNLFNRKASSKSKLQMGQISNGYGDKVEAIQSIDSVSDTDLMLRQFEAMQREERIKTENNLSANKNYFKPPTRKMVNEVKGTLYSTTDAISGLINSPKEVGYKPVMASSNFKAGVKPLNNDDLNLKVQQLVPNLASKNPLVRIKAERKIQNLERQKIKRQRDTNREVNYQKAKEFLFTARDVVSQTADYIRMIPDSAQEAAVQTQQFAASTKTLAENTISNIQATPATIESTINDVTNAIDDTKKTTQVVIQDIQNIPNTVQSKISETSRNVEETVKSVQDTVEKVQQIPTNIKISVGLLPKPSPPPRPKTETEIASEVFGNVMKTLVKVAWVFTKGAFGLGAAGAKAALGNVQKETDEDVRKGTFISKRVFALSRQTNPKAKRDKPIITSVADVDAKLNEEVNTALDLANAALAQADKKEAISSYKEKTKNTQVATPKSTLESAVMIREVEDDDYDVSEIENALTRAREAAARATSDAKSIEDMFQKK